MAGEDLGGVLAVGDITDVVQRLDLPVPADPGGEFFGLGLVRGEAGDGEDGDGLPSSAVAGAGPAGDADGLGGVREGQPLGDRADLDGAAVVNGVTVTEMTSRSRWPRRSPGTPFPGAEAWCSLAVPWSCPNVWKGA